ncbi:hypothetical protein AAHC03_047 [Spirometra sp. Aus1]
MAPVHRPPASKPHCVSPNAGGHGRTIIVLASSHVPITVVIGDLSRRWLRAACPGGCDIPDWSKWRDLRAKATRWGSECVNVCWSGLQAVSTTSLPQSVRNASAKCSPLCFVSPAFDLDIYRFSAV